jgi:hypothetical protein
MDSVHDMLVYEGCILIAVQPEEHQLDSPTSHKPEDHAQSQNVPAPSKANLGLTSENEAFQQFQDSINFFFSESVQTGGLSQEFLQHLESLNKIPHEKEPTPSTPTQSDFVCSSRPIRVRPDGLAHVLTQSELEVYNHVIRSHCSNAEANEWLRIVTKVIMSLYMTDHDLVHEEHVLVHE